MPAAATKRRRSAPATTPAAEAPAPQVHPAPDHEQIEAGELRRVAVAEIRASVYQPRTTFNEAALAELADSMRETGLLQPITVRPVTPTAEQPETYELVAGERRWRAAQRLGWTDIPAVVKVLSDEQAAAAAMIENLQRRDLSPLEEARGFAFLMLAHHWSQAELARRLGVPRSTVGDRARLLELPAPWMELLDAGVLTSSHAAPLHVFRAVPDRYHVEARANAEKTWAWKRAAEEGRPLEVAEFTTLIHDVYSRYLHPLDEGTWPRCELDPQAYDGPVITAKLRGDARQRRWAADPEQWEPLVKAARAKASSRDSSSRDGASRTEAKPVAKKGSLKITLPKGAEVVKRTYSGGTKADGAVLLTTTDGRWDTHGALRDVDVDVLAKWLTRADIIRVAEPLNNGIDRTATRDDLALERARTAWEESWAERAAELRAAYTRELHERAADYVVRGPGVRELLGALLSVEYELAETLIACARALAIVTPELGEHVWEWDENELRAWIGVLSVEEAERLAQAFAAARAGVVHTPDEQLDREQEAARVSQRTKPVPWIEGSGGALATCRGCKRTLEEEDLQDGLCVECEDAQPDVSAEAAELEADGDDDADDLFDGADA